MTIKIGISSCLLGNNMRYDGEHNYDEFLFNTLGEFAKFVPICPEAECGMTVPREPVNLVGDPENPRVLTRETGVDKTAQLTTWIKNKLNVLAKENLSAFVFKAKSPSCGLYNVKVYSKDGSYKRIGTGLFAMAFTKRFPEIPAENGENLHDPEILKRFINSIHS